LLPRAAYITLALCLGVLFYWHFTDSGTSDASPGKRPTKRGQPLEFFYLDNARILAYLSQLDGGLTESQTETFSQSETLNGGIKAGAVLEGSIQQQGSNQVSLILTPTATSLATTLIMDKLQLTNITIGADNSATKWKSLRPGQFARITGCGFRLPGYIRLYEAARTALHHKLSPGQLADVQTALQSMGQNPRIGARMVIGLAAAGSGSTSIGADGSECESNGRKEKTTSQEILLVPMAYRNIISHLQPLTGHVTVIGKVIRVVSGRGRYIDVQTRASLPLTFLSKDRHFLWGRAHLAPGKIQVDSATTIKKHRGIVIVPFAVYA
jgi:hypothetical protein